MKNRAETITKYNKESSAQTRIQAWQAAVRMIKDNPFCGVGLGSFFTAFSDYSDKTPREAHNTFFSNISGMWNFSRNKLGYITLFNV